VVRKVRLGVISGAQMVRHVCLLAQNALGALGGSLDGALGDGGALGALDIAIKGTRGAIGEFDVPRRCIG
jgi:hypothetical protein